jgi:hypothetical protein
VAELAVPSWTPADVAPHATAVALPAAHAQALLRLAQLGHAQGMQRALDALAEEHPECKPKADALRSLVERFAWSELIAQLGGDLQMTDKEPAA